MYRRQPAVSGLFYPSSSTDLALTVQGYLEETTGSTAIGIVSPHAGYVYSGRVKGAIYSVVDIPPTVLLLGPNHRPVFVKTPGKASLFPSGFFLTPLGDVPIDEEFARLLLSGGDVIVEDVESHGPEHSLEVQLPFLQVKRPDVRIVPILLNFGWDRDYNSLHDDCTELGSIISGAIEDYGDDILIVASSDMNHHESREITRVKDEHALARIEDLDVAGFLEVTEKEYITVCGKIAVATMLEAALLLGATEAKVVMYGDSADASGDPSEVVGYAGILVR